MSQDFEDKIINLNEDDSMDLEGIDEFADELANEDAKKDNKITDSANTNKAKDINKTTNTDNQDDDSKNDEVGLEKPANSGRLKSFIKDLWNNPKKRWGIVFGALFIFVAVLLIPPSRYFILNVAGVRSSASITILDESTGQPLKNVAVAIGAAEEKTDNKGFVKFSKLKLGKTKLVVKKRAFAESSNVITIGWGSNPLGEQKLKPVGLQYSFDLRDFLSDKPIENAEAVSEDYSAFSNKEGRLVLTIDQPEEDTAKITIKADGYRDEIIEQKTENKEIQTVKMAPSRPHIFVSKRSGKFDVYKIDADGANEQLILSGTGNERDDITLSPSTDKDVVAVVSSRDGSRNKDGYLLNNLTLIDFSKDELKIEQISKSERIQILGWSGSKIIYLKTKDGASVSTPDREQIISYDTDNSSTREISRGNAFNIAKLIDNKIYYAPSAALSPDKKGLFKVSVDGEDKKILIEDEVWDLIRSDFDTLKFSVRNDWYEYNIRNEKIMTLSGAPNLNSSKSFVGSQDNKNSIWIDNRDGKGVIINHIVESKQDKVIVSLHGLSSPVVWLNNSTIVFRVVSGQESADYAVSIDGGEAKRIIDVTSTRGVGDDRYY